MENVAFAAAFASIVPYLMQAPVLMVLLLAAVIAGVRRQRHPAVSSLVIAFALIEMALVLASTWASFNLPRLLLDRGVRPADIADVFFYFGVARAILGAATLALILWAALVWRTPTAAPSQLEFR